MHYKVQNNFIDLKSFCRACGGNVPIRMLSELQISIQNPQQQLLLVTARNSSCGKVMFSQVCVKNSVHRWACVAGRGRAGETATKAGGTHPTGMHSCYKDNFS